LAGNHTHNATHHGKISVDNRFDFIEGDLSQAKFGRGYDLAILGIFSIAKANNVLVNCSRKVIAH
jgi:hypothetical protein